jgi:hypothetical protein
MDFAKTFTVINSLGKIHKLLPVLGYCGFTQNHISLRIIHNILPEQVILSTLQHLGQGM